MKKTAIYMTFGIALAVMVASFLTAKTYTQLILTSAVYPLIAYMGFRLFLDARVITSAGKHIVTEPVRSAPVGEPEKKIIDIVDIDKRAFLKLILGTGLSFFLFSLFAKKTEDILFPRSASVPPGFSAGGINADSQSMNGYRISEIDDSDFTFYGFINGDGAWFIMKEDPMSGTFRYARGDRNFPTAWSTRKTQLYDYYHNLF